MEQRLAKRQSSGLLLGWLAAGKDFEDHPFRRPIGSRPRNAADELPYLVELWDEEKQAVDLVLAVTAHGSIGFAAYYAAIREYPNRYVTLRLNDKTIARSSEPRQ